MLHHSDFDFVLEPYCFVEADGTFSVFEGKRDEADLVRWALGQLCAALSSRFRPVGSSSKTLGSKVVWGSMFDDGQENGKH